MVTQYMGAGKDQFLLFELCKAFDLTVTNRKDLLSFMRAQHVLSYPSYISSMIRMKNDTVNRMNI